MVHGGRPGHDRAEGHSTTLRAQIGGIGWITALKSGAIRSLG
jgi:hypothetical protein